jgi:hypothetical protein
VEEATGLPDSPADVPAGQRIADRDLGNDRRPVLLARVPHRRLGIGVAANAWDAYSRDLPTETEIRREMNRLRSSS